MSEQLETYRALWAQKDHVAFLGNFNYVILSEEELMPGFHSLGGQMWGDDQDVDVDLALSEQEQASIGRHSAAFGQLYHLYLGLFDGDRLIGWSWGRQESGEEFHMVVSNLLPEYRSRGIYTALLPHLLGLLQEQGFQVVYSWHQSDNPAVLVPKLKAGFVISGVRMFDRFGLLVQLSYYFNPTRRELFSYRIGRARLNERTAPLLK